MKRTKREWDEIWRNWYAPEFGCERHEVKHPRRVPRHPRPEPPPIHCERCQVNTREGYVLHDGHHWCLTCAAVEMDR